MDKTLEYIDVIREKYPNITIREYEKNTIGQKNDVIMINNKLVFRFPKYKDGIKKLKIETEVLKMLNNHRALNIPNPIYNNFEKHEIGKFFSGYRMIPGKPLWRDTFLNIEDKQIIANQLANFLKEFHNILTDEVKELDIPVCDSYQKWKDFSNEIKGKLFRFMREDAKLQFENHFKVFLSKEENFDFETTLVHGDFGPSNILYDEETKRVSGIIDFGEVRYDDPAIDFASMIGPFGYGEAFIRRFHNVYKGIDQLIERAKFYASTFALQEALFGFENKDEKTFNSGMEQYI